MAVFENATLSSHVFLSDGSTHVRIDEIDDFYRRFRTAMEEDPTAPERLAKHFIGRGEEWVASCEEWFLPREGLREASADRLVVLLGKFCDSYSAYAPALYLPFAVERLYAEEFEGVLERVAEGLGKTLEVRLEAAPPELARYHAADLVRVVDRRAVAEAIRPLVESTPLRTAAEQKDEALADLASRLHARGLTSDSALSDQQLSDPNLEALLSEIKSRFGWIAQWGYPPRYQESSKADLLKEALVRLDRMHEGAPRRQQDSRGLAVDELLDDAEASGRDRRLIADFAYYNYYRTRRMELLIRAQYLSAPLFEEIGNRIGVAAGEWASLTPLELQAALRGDLAQDELEERAKTRADGWLLFADGLRGIRNLFDGLQYSEQEEAYAAVLRAGENARGSADGSDPRLVGGKAASLGKLAGNGYLVPDYVVLTTRGARSLARTGDGSPASRALRLAVEEIDGSGRLAVRSSASVEDGATHSWAGRFESVLDVRPEGLLPAVEAVITSASSDRVRAYAERTETPELEIEMAVIVQRQVEAELAGVINTSVPTSKGHAIEIEVVPGLGDKLVDGSTTPARFLVAMDGSVERSGPDLGISPDLLEELAEVAKRIEADFGAPQDIEFAIQGGRIFVVQSRPLTGSASGSSEGGGEVESPGGSEVLSGLKGHVSQRVRGVVVKPSHPREIDRLEPGTILVLRAATPVWDTIVFQAEGLVTDEGGSTSHAIRVANELSIPAVVGARIATSTLEAGETIILDTTGETGRGRV
ncbi:MAG TPA: PEP/pyruvate-binding domain-containing protein, partial [Solirubrobacterales bacterium]|nr:PEP/pyruvate-binding domain-containing protein [Solirubrobacterales bacterium]